MFQLNNSNPKDTNETAKEIGRENTVAKFKFTFYDRWLTVWGRSSWSCLPKNPKICFPEEVWQPIVWLLCIVFISSKAFVWVKEWIYTRRFCLCNSLFPGLTFKKDNLPTLWVSIDRLRRSFQFLYKIPDYEERLAIPEKKINSMEKWEISWSLFFLYFL